jgi:NhaA family Na+:H+ antiporter
MIALFYSSSVEVRGLALAALGVIGILSLRLFGVRRRAVYVIPAVVIWLGVMAAGIHPTIAGVIVGLLTPVQAWLGPELFSQATREELAHLERSHVAAASPDEVAASLQRIARMRREALSPAESLIEALHPWVAFVVMPLFALANAGVTLGAVTFDGSSTRVTLAVVVGLVLGKPLGIVLASSAAVRARLAVMPAGLELRHLVVLGIVAGIGFTMALFVAQLAFARDGLLDAAKMGVLGASVVAGVLGLAAGAWLLGPVATTAAASADEAEHATRV